MKILVPDRTVSVSAFILVSGHGFVNHGEPAQFNRRLL